MSSGRSTTLRIVVADDHAVVREGIRRVLESEPGIEVVAEAGDGHQALEMVVQHQPDVLVVDVGMPGLTGIEVAAEISRRRLSTRVLVLSMYDEPAYVEASLRAGALGYLLKDSPPADLRRAVHSTGRGDKVLSQALAARLAAAARAPAESPMSHLTPRETEVLIGIASGLTNKEIAARYKISPRTVETHREAMMAKLGIRTIAGLTRLAIG